MRVVLISIAMAAACGSKSDQLPEGEHPPQEDKPDPRLALALPQVTTGYAPFVNAPTEVTVGPAAIVMDGVSVVALRDGTVDAGDLDSGSLGMKITKLAQAAKVIVEKT
ncbi:MAG: hypothetical protein H0V17_17780, partial [Deltaproteobacteria bacterium]|nr:hypothetical protein [Deltaproteobacteria bacterium]